MTEAVVIVTVCDRQETADGIATRLVEERLAACVQVGGPVQSTYRWDGRLERTEEWTCQVKTARTRVSAILERIASLHPYDVPEILVLPVLDGHPEYLAWLASEVS